MIKRPVLAKNMMMMLLVAAVVLAVFLPISSRIQQSERNKVVDEHRFYFQRSVDTLDNTIRNVQQIKTLLNKSFTFQKIRSMTDKTDMTYYAQLDDATNIIQNTFLLTNSSRPTFIFLSNSGSVIESRLLSDDYLYFFTKLLVFSNMTPDDVVSALRPDSRTTVFLPQSIISYMGNQDTYLPFVYRDYYDSAPLCVLFPSSELISLFNLNSYATEDYFFYIAPASGSQTPVFAQNPDNILIGGRESSQYTVFRSKLSNMDYEMVLGIPDVYFDYYVRRVQILLYATLMAAVLAAVLVSYLLAARSYLPVRKLLSLTQQAGSKGSRKAQNEYACINYYIEQLSQDNQSLNSHINGLRNEMRSNTLIRLLFEFPQIEDEYTIYLSLLPQLADDFRIGVVSFETDSEPMMMALEGHLAGQLNEFFCLARQKKRYLVILLPDRPDCLSLLETSIGCTIHAMGYRLHAGVSGSCGSAKEIRLALYQAQKALLDRKPFSVFSEDPETGRQPLHFNLSSLSRLHHALASGNGDQARDMIRTIARSSADPADDIQVPQTYYMVRSVIEDVWAISGIDAAMIPDYQRWLPIPELFEQLVDFAMTICRSADNKSCVDSQRLRQDIIDYIHLNFLNPELSCSMIAAHFHISNTYVFRLVKEQTGSSLSKYIEVMRMELAMEKVKSTSLPMTEVAPLCGYYTLNNFYKVFHRFYGRPPGAFRKSS